MAQKPQFAQALQEKAPQPDSFSQRLWHWLIEPSPQIAESDQRRQAALLTGFILGLILLATVVELVTDLLIDWANYTGYRQTIIVVVCLGVVYFISRTRQVQLAAIMAIMVAIAGIFISAWIEPRGVLGGFFDFLILPLWLGSLYLGMKKLSALILVALAGILLFPLLTPLVSLDIILIGPFSFIAATSIILLIITRHRNRLELDRRADLIENERHSRREAARAETLLHAAGRLNAQLDLQILLETVSEEVGRGLATQVSIVTLYDKQHSRLMVSAGHGLPPDLIQSILSLPIATFDETIRQLGPFFKLLDLQTKPDLPYAQYFKQLDLRSMAFATMKYEDEFIGSLMALSQGEPLDFSEEELLLLQGLADQAALAIVNVRLYKDAHRRLEYLQALHAIEVAIATSRDLPETLAVLLTHITGQLHVDAAVFLLLNPNSQKLEYAAGLDFPTPILPFTSLEIGQGVAGRAAQEQRIIHVPDLRTEPQTLLMASALAKAGFISYFAAPLVAQGVVVGVLEIFHRSQNEPDEEWLDFLSALAGQAALAVQNTSLFQGLQQSNQELSLAYDSTIEGWSHALDLRDKETEGHTRRVTEMTLHLARAFMFSEADLVHIRRGALLHDIGKLGVPDRILLKEGPLLPDEWEIMIKHPIFAQEMLEPIEYLRPALDIPYCHHEKWDGTGYPRGLAGKQIPLAARIFSLVDVWDALTSDRPYRKAWTRDKVHEFILSQAGIHFDPLLVEPFLRLVEAMDKS